MAEPGEPQEPVDADAVAAALTGPETEQRSALETFSTKKLLMGGGAAVLITTGTMLVDHDNEAARADPQRRSAVRHWGGTVLFVLGWLMFLVVVAMETRGGLLPASTRTWVALGLAGFAALTLGLHQWGKRTDRWAVSVPAFMLLWMGVGTAVAADPSSLTNEAPGVRFSQHRAVTAGLSSAAIVAGAGLATLWQGPRQIVHGPGMALVGAGWAGLITANAMHS
jgi:hypothetical protein